MAIRTGMRRETMWIKVFIVAFMVIAVTFAFAAETLAIPINVRLPDGRILHITLDDDYQFQRAQIQGQDVQVSISESQPLPITLPGYSKPIKEIRRGSVIIFEGSICIPLPDGHGGVIWIGYPQGTVCP